MKKIVKILPILLAIAMLMSVAACNKTVEQAPSSTSPPPVQTPTPTPTPTTVPTTSPAPINPAISLLEYEEFYYVYGDPHMDGCMFYSDGTVLDTYGEPATYEVNGSTIAIFYNGEQVLTLQIVDEYTLTDIESELLFIREGGEGYGSINDEDNTYSVPVVFFNEYYYLDSETDQFSIYFWDDGDVDLGDPDEFERGTYTIEDGIIAIYLNGQQLGSLEVVNHAVITDVETGAVYALEGTFDNKLETGEFYYFVFFGEAVGAIVFWDDWTVGILESMEDDELSDGTYSISGDTITVEQEGEEMVFSIINSYVLEYEGFHFVRIP